MKTYRVELQYYCEYEVDADTEEEAIERAIAEWDDYTDPKVTYIEEMGESEI